MINGVSLAAFGKRMASLEGTRTGRATRPLLAMIEAV
jgi:hypothetical protein